MKNESKYQGIVLTTIMITAIVAIILGVGLWVVNSGVFNSDSDYYNDTELLFNPVTYMDECIAPTYEEFIQNYESYENMGLRFYGQVMSIDKTVIGNSTEILIKVPKFDEKTDKIVEAEQYMICDTKLDTEEYKMYQGDNIFIYGEFNGTDGKTNYPIMKVKAIKVDTDE